MIPEFDFKKALANLCALCGIKKPDQAQGELFYSKLKVFELTDFVQAMNDEGLISDLARARVLIYPRIREAVFFYQSKRQSAEHEKLKKLSEKDFERMPEGEIKKLIRGFIKSL